MASFGVDQHRAPVLLLVTLYTLFVGLVLYIVLALSDPFQASFGIAPTSFEYLVETLQSEIGQGYSSAPAYHCFFGATL